MAYEIFISRGVAGLPNTPQSISTPLSTGPCLLKPKTAGHRPGYVRTRSLSSVLGHPAQTARAGLGDISGACFLPMDEEPCSPRHLGGSTVSRTLKEGHALRERHQAPAGAKSRHENSDLANYGRMSDKRPPSISIFPQELLTDRQRQYSHDGSTPRDFIHSLFARPTITETRYRSSLLRVSSSPVPLHSTSPRILSEGSTRGAGDKVYRHAKKPTVTFTDGPVDTSGLGGEPALIIKKTPTDPQNTQHDPSFALRVQFASPIDLRDDMASGNNQIDNETASTLFLDPFRGCPTDLGRQLSDISDLSGYIRPQAFSRHRDTLARISWSPTSSEDETEDEGFQSDEETSLLTSQYTTLNKPPRLCPSTIAYLPAEILHEIFVLLQPCDFEAARHACRSWFVASLDRRVTDRMLRKAGCYSAFLADINLSRQLQYTCRSQMRADLESGNGQEINTSGRRNSDDGIFNEHWLASKRLATESRLSAAWHGASLHDGIAYNTSRMFVKETVNFQRIMTPAARRGLSDVDTFSVSTCGKFLLVVSGSDIFVYRMGNGAQSLHPIVRLVADSNVLKVSMDTSSRRFAIAALLENRTGACWEIDDVIFSGAVDTLAGLTPDVVQGKQDAAITPQLVPGNSVPLPTRRDEITIIADGEDPSSFHVFQGQSPVSTPGCGGGSSGCPTSSGTIMSYQAEEIHSRSSLPVRVKPNAVYHNLGTANDPPRSVAICPQRKCAAFGCRAGIELHWVDASTGKDLHRWFPLAAPSDHLYFLPQRSPAESGKKLRLISSAAGPAERSKICFGRSQKEANSGSVSYGRGRGRSMTRLFSGHLPIPLTSTGEGQDAHEDGTIARMAACDHYRAVPLSDGQHMLFTDPVTGLLCLGSDAPLGGPTKLVRKACMVPPASDAGVIDRATPICYAAASDLQWGVRIIAAYDDGRIVLYTIPSDCFERLRHVRSSPDVWDDIPTFVGQSDLMMDVFMVNQEHAMAGGNPEASHRFRSLQIDGAFLGYVDADVENLALDASGGGLQAWVFHASGQATQMDVFVPQDHRITSRYIGVDGLAHDVPRTPAAGPVIKDSQSLQKGEQEADDYFGAHVRFVGLDGCCDSVSPMCGPMVHKHEIDYSDLPRDEGISMTPGASDNEDDDNWPLQVELLTDWRTESLLRPYIVNVAWIEAH